MTELRLAGPVVIVQSDTDPGDMGEPRVVDADGETIVIVPSFGLWAAARSQPEAGTDYDRGYKEGYHWGLRSRLGATPAAGLDALASMLDDELRRVQAGYSTPETIQRARDTYARLAKKP